MQILSETTTINTTTWKVNIFAHLSAHRNVVQWNGCHIQTPSLPICLPLTHFYRSLHSINFTEITNENNQHHSKQSALYLLFKETSETFFFCMYRVTHHREVVFHVQARISVYESQFIANEVNSNYIIPEIVYCDLSFKSDVLYTFHVWSMIILYLFYESIGISTALIIMLHVLDWLCFSCCQSFWNIGPIDDVEKGFDVVQSHIFVLQIVCVLPNIDAKQWDQTWTEIREIQKWRMTQSNLKNTIYFIPVVASNGSWLAQVASCTVPVFLL